MSTQPQFAVQHIPPEPGGTSSAEKYGSDNLPVLIRLPDLSVSSGDAAVAELGVEDQCPTADLTENAKADEPTIIPMDNSEAETAAEPTADGEPTAGPQQEGMREQRQRRRQRARRNAQTPIPAWLRGMSQLALAAVVAGILLVVIVALKTWSADDVQDSPRTDDASFVEAPTLDFGEPFMGATANVDGPQGPDLGPPTLTDHESSLGNESSAIPPIPAHRPAEPVFYGEQSRAAAAVPAAAGLSHPTANAGQYPSTGIPDVGVPGAVTGQDAQPRSVTLPLGPVRNAERATPPNFNQRHR